LTSKPGHSTPSSLSSIVRRHFYSDLEAGVSSAAGNTSRTASPEWNRNQEVRGSGKISTELGGPFLAALSQRAGVSAVTSLSAYLCLHSLRAEGSQAILRRRTRALYHLQLLPSPTLAGHRATSQSVRSHSGANPAAPWIRRSRLPGHARAFSSSNNRAATGRSIPSDAIAETTLRAASHTAIASHAISHKECSGSVAAACMAGSLLRLQRLDRAQANRETALHASQSGKTQTGAGTAAVAVEQFSGLSLRPDGEGSGE
jgi:hypothetical protein